MDELEPKIDMKRVAARTIELLSGVENFRKLTGAEFGEMQSRWSQDVDKIGRILRSHLYVEHYLTQHIEKANPRLGSLSAAKLSFSQKIELLDKNDRQIAEVLPGIRRLNAVRNRLAHKLSAALTEEDAMVFLEAKSFAALRIEGAKPNVPSEDPLDILERFSQYASHALSHEFSSFAKAFATALEEDKNKREA